MHERRLPQAISYSNRLGEQAFALCHNRLQVLSPIEKNGRGYVGPIGPLQGAKIAIQPDLAEQIVISQRTKDRSGQDWLEVDCPLAVLSSKVTLIT